MLRQLGRRLAAQPRAAVAAAALPALSATLPRLYSKVAEGLHYAKSHEARARAAAAAQQPS